MNYNENVLKLDIGVVHNQDTSKLTLLTIYDLHEGTKVYQPPNTSGKKLILWA